MGTAAPDFLAVFNACESPKDALRAAQEAGLSADALGRLLYEQGDKVSVGLLGACLGHHGELGAWLAGSYPRNFAEFAGMDVVAAIRLYLWRFRLPGEAAQIDRILTGFACAFFARSPPAPRGSPCGGNSAWDARARGWYVRQPAAGPGGPCCAHCGALGGGEVGEVLPCTGCGLVCFCRRCRKLASRRGHAVAGALGYGRACVAARRAAEGLPSDAEIAFRRLDGEAVTVGKGESTWERTSPFQSEDSVMVLAFSIIMLTTNLHSANVKSKMQQHEFIRQNRDINDGGNFPGDFLAQIYDNIKAEELKVMRTAG